MPESVLKKNNKIDKYNLQDLYKYWYVGFT